MPDEVRWILLATCAVGAALLVAAVWLRPRGVRDRCPGSRSRLQRLRPAWLVLRRGCWYPLTGLAEDEGGRIRCPECGCESLAHHRLRAGRTLRLGVIGCAVLIAGFGWGSGIWWSSGSWVTLVPDVALVEIEGIDAMQSRRLARELDARVEAGEIVGRDSRRLAALLVAELCSDDVSWNAHRARWLLDAMWPDSKQALERALVSGDAQSRVSAGRILRRRHSGEPPKALIWACVEDLRDDRGRGRDRYEYCYNAQQAFGYLLQHPTGIGGDLERGMRSSDRQQRLLSAAVAGKAGLTELVDMAAPILIGHLRDNDVQADAAIAFSSLYGFGEAALPHLRPHADDADDQLRQCVRALIERIENPDAPPRGMANSPPPITVRSRFPFEIDLRGSISDLRWPR